MQSKSNSNISPRADLFSERRIQERAASRGFDHFVDIIYLNLFHSVLFASVVVDDGLRSGVLRNVGEGEHQCQHRLRTLG